MKTKEVRLKYKLSQLVPYEDPTPTVKTNIQPNTRVTYLGGITKPPACSSLLSRGPNFAIAKTDKKSTEKMLLEAEIGLERHSFGVRWNKHLVVGRKQTEEKNIGIVRPEAPKQQPYPLTRSREQEILTTKVEVMEAYKKSLKTELKNNLTKAEMKELKALRKDKDIIIKVSDKDKQFVVSPKSMYIEKVSEMLADTKTYQKLKKNPLPSVTKDVMSVAGELELHLPKLGEITKPYYRRIPEFYCSWKTHKNQSPPPLRPVTSQCDGPTERLAAP